MRTNLFITIALTALVLFSSVKTVEASLLKGFLKQNVTANLLDHFMKGMKINELASNTTECVHYSEDAYFHLKSSIQNMTEGNWNVSTHLYFLSSLGNLTPMIKTCYNTTKNGTAEFFEHFNGFHNFTDFMNQTATHVMEHYWDWYKITSSLMFALEGNRTDEVAYQLGAATRLIIDVTPRSAKLDILRSSQPSNSFNLKLPDLRPYERFFSGFINGSHIFNSTNITHCVNETKFMADAFENATYGLSNKTTDGYEHALFDIADVLEHLAPHTEACYGGLIDIMDILNRYNQTIYSPTQLGITAFRNSPALYADAVSAYESYHSSNYTAMGWRIGDFFFNLFANN
ncbi:unnamed protein product [Moneuplotes crassus]|uniref:Uncharacterized protein n=1 Tax=Euplotes crassus TaxID=5936 RepID=A0AAD1XI37_EUPCR|nr:unnamed protein product [Moneuplotes crassus]